MFSLSQLICLYLCLIRHNCTKDQVRVCHSGHIQILEQSRHIWSTRTCQPPLMLYIIKSCCDNSDVANELFHPNFPLPYKPFGNPLWISHMHILIYIPSVFCDHYETQSPFESGHKTAWSQVNCQTQTRVLIINAILHTAALNHRQIFPSPLWCLPKWFGLNL